MGAAGDVGMDEGRAGKVRRVSVNSAVCSFVFIYVLRP
jgi:hypothetical protein